eukprot:7148816-Prymnesium_polylepis.1
MPPADRLPRVPACPLHVADHPRQAQRVLGRRAERARSCRIFRRPEVSVHLTLPRLLRHESTNVIYVAVALLQ